MSDDHSSGKEPPEDEAQHEPQFDQKQYDLLKRCSDKKDLKEWNEWRQRHRRMPVLLEGAKLTMAHLEGAKLQKAHLEGADIRWVHLEAVDLINTHLERANCSFAVVDGATLLQDCIVDTRTDFTGVGLDEARVAPGLKQLLEYNVRRIGWEGWYKNHPKLTYPVGLFWAMSDYGRSTGRILRAFLILSIAFAAIYWLWGLVLSPGVVANLFDTGGPVSEPIAWWLVPLRAVYFSIVTMTTLGFGDMHAQPHSLCGHVLLTVQVMLGYVLLAALVTRFAVLFTAGGPAANHLLRERVTSWGHFQWMLRRDMRRRWPRFCGWHRRVRRWRHETLRPGLAAAWRWLQRALAWCGRAMLRGLAWLAPRCHSAAARVRTWAAHWRARWKRKADTHER